MTDQSKTIASSYMCGSDLDNYLKNPHYVGPFSQETKMLNKYVAKQSKKPLCCPSSKCCGPPKCCAPPKCCGPPKCCPSKKPKKYNLNCSQYAREPECPDCAASKKDSKEDKEEMEERKRQARCNWIADRGKEMVTQMQRTTLVPFCIESDPKLPSQLGQGWIIATEKKKYKKSKYTLTPYDPYAIVQKRKCGGLESDIEIVIKTDDMRTKDENETEEKIEEKIEEEDGEISEKLY